MIGLPFDRVVSSSASAVRRLPTRGGLALVSFLVALAALASPARAQDAPREDLLAFARGVVPTSVAGAGADLGVGVDQALLLIDGDERGFTLTPKPGAADVAVSFVYELPARTTFTEFAVPNVLETPSPSQTFFQRVVIEGADASATGPFRELAAATLTTHAKKGEVTSFAAHPGTPVRWVRVTLAGGIQVERDKTFFEFSEIVGHGTQEQVPLSTAFTGKWKGRGATLVLAQDGVRVRGCYDGEGDLEGSVSGNLLYATGATRKAGIPSAFVLAVGDEGEIVGVRSTNGAPFKLYSADAAPSLEAECPGAQPKPIGCGSILHGIAFDFDSATIRPEAEAHLDALHAGLASTGSSAIVVVGHTSSEGSDAYNQELSQRRAKAVVEALVARGLDSARVSAAGRGESEPIAENDTEAGRALNRRVEIECR